MKKEALQAASVAADALKDKLTIAVNEFIDSQMIETHAHEDTFRGIIISGASMNLANLLAALCVGHKDPDKLIDTTLATIKVMYLSKKDIANKLVADAQNRGRHN